MKNNKSFCYEIMKLFAYLLIVFLLFGCGNQNNVEKADELNGNNVHDQNGNGTSNQEEESREIIVWDVLPTLEYDEIENWLTTRKMLYSNFHSEGMNSGYIVEPQYVYAVSYDREDFYNSDGYDQFILGSFEKGGLMVKKNGKWGLINSKGEIKTECSHIYSTHLLYGVLFNDGFINHDYTVKKYTDGHPGGGIGLSMVFVDLNGTVYNCDMDSLEQDHRIYKVDLFKEAKDSGFVKDDDFLVLNTFASSIDHENYCPELKLPVNCIEAYTIIDKNGYRFLDLPENYVINDVSDGVISFAECTSDPRQYNISGDQYGGKLAMYYYAYELYCDMFKYKNYTFVDREGNLIARGFDDAYGFYEGYAAVKKNGKWGFIDKDGNVVVDYIFDKATAVSQGKSWVIYNGKTGRLNLVELLENNVEINPDCLGLEKTIQK